MKKTVLTFRLNNKEKIVINLSDFDAVHCCYMVKIFLVQYGQKILLSRDVLSYNMKRLKELLEKALINELQLHEAITKDIGYLSNQDSAQFCGQKLKEPTFLNFIDRDGRQYWPGYDYNLWSRDLETWIYNDKDGNIIFEVTPVYPCLTCKRKKDKHYIAYKKWIKTYRPYLIRIIPVEIAQQWLEQADFAIKKIQDNIERFEKEAEESGVPLPASFYRIMFLD